MLACLPSGVVRLRTVDTFGERVDKQCLAIARRLHIRVSDDGNDDRVSLVTIQ